MHLIGSNNDYGLYNKVTDTANLYSSWQAPPNFPTSYHDSYGFQRIFLGKMIRNSSRV